MPARRKPATGWPLNRSLQTTSARRSIGTSTNFYLLGKTGPSLTARSRIDDAEANQFMTDTNANLAVAPGIMASWRGIGDISGSNSTETGELFRADSSLPLGKMRGGMSSWLIGKTYR